MNVLDIFSGIGGFTLGLERSGGFKTIAFCESDRDCTVVLQRHWPMVPVFGDVRTLDCWLGFADLIVGGFPCQPHSTVSRGRRTAVDLWPEFIRVVKSCRPRWVAAENVPGIGHGGIERVCGDFEDAGYAVWPFDLDVALPQRQRGRHRIVWLAHANGDRKPRCAEHAQMARLCALPVRREAHEPAPVGMDDELPGRMDRLHQLGNAIPPHIGEIIGRAIMRAAHG